MVADIEGAGKFRRDRNPCSKAQCKRGKNSNKRCEHFVFPIADGTAKLFGRDCGVRESTPWREQPVRSGDLRDDLKGNSEKSQPTDDTKDDAEAHHDFWSMERDSICRHHVEPRVQRYVPKEETFPIPLKYVDGTRTARTNLDVLQETRIVDYWSVKVDRTLSDSWTGFTKFMCVVRGAACTHSGNCQTWFFVA